MKTERMLSIVSKRLNYSGRKLDLHENIAVVWHLEKAPQQLPDSKYTGMIMTPGIKGCLVFSVSKRDHKFYDDNPHVTNKWVNPLVCGLDNKWLKPFHDGRNKKQKVTVRTESGVDTIMDL